jgi:hypothetical protein
MKKVIKPSKQPTKKQNMRNVRSQRSQRNKQTAKLKIAIGKIAAQLVKDHPKLVKGGGSSDITELIFSKNLMKGGEIKPELRADIVKFLKDSAQKVNDLKKELIIKVIQNFIDAEEGTKYTVSDERKRIIDIDEDFKKGVYDEYKADYKENFKDLEDIYDDFIILDIVKKFYILSRITENDIKEINKSNFKGLSDEIIAAFNNYGHDKPDKVEVKEKIRTLLEVYKSAGTEAVKDGAEDKKEEKKDEVVNIPDNDSKYALLVANAEEVYEKNDDIVKRITDSSVLKLVENDTKIYINDEVELDAEKTKNLEDFNTLYTELKDKTTKIKAEMGSFNEITPPDDKITAVQKLIDEFNSSYKKIVLSYQIFGITINVPNLQDDEVDDTTRTPSTELVVFDPKPGGSGGNLTKYKSTGQVVNIMYKKRKYKRTIFVKEKRKTKYCKINNEYILLSKLNVL